jgi:hypothetical protein
MNPDASTTLKAPAFPALRSLAICLGSIAATTALFDQMFWDGHWGFSTGVFFGGLAALILARHPKARPGATTITTLLLLLASIVQSAIETSLSNAIACAVLVLVLAGCVFHPQLKSHWARVSEIVFGIITSPARWLGVGAKATTTLGELRIPGISIGSIAAKAAWVFAPAAFLLLVFTFVFAAGNPIFAAFIQRMEERAVSIWTLIDLTPVRIFVWGIIATVALGLFHGASAPDAPRWWTRTLPRLPRPDYNLAALQSAAVLVALNGLFFLVNTLDGIHLWKHHTLPVGINRSDLVHEGVNASIVAVLLSTVIIAGIFQQEDRVISKRWLKWISHVWVLQNLALIASSFLRLKFYAQDYMLTEKRIYAGCFLALVAAGFLILLWFVAKRRSFNWLLGMNAIATFTLFFILQFTNTAAVVAGYNLERWKSEKTTLDTAYMASLGPGAWPSLLEVSRASGYHSAAREARGYLEVLAEQGEDSDWRATQLRRSAALAEIKAFLAATPR